MELHYPAHTSEALECPELDCEIALLRLREIPFLHTIPVHTKDRSIVRKLL